MCFINKKIKKQINDLQQNINELTKIIKTQELVKLREDSKKLKETNDLLSNLHFKLKNVQLFDDPDTFSQYVRVSLEFPAILVRIDQNGNVIKNDQLRAINLLDLVSLEDTMKIQKTIEEGKEKYK